MVSQPYSIFDLILETHQDLAEISFLPLPSTTHVLLALSKAQAHFSLSAAARRPHKCLVLE